MYRAYVVIMLFLILATQSACGHMMPAPDFDYSGRTKFNFARIYDLDEVDLTVNQADPFTVAAECYKMASWPQKIAGANVIMPPSCAWVKAHPTDPTYTPKCIIWYTFERHLKHELIHCTGRPYKVPTYTEVARQR